MYSIFIHIFFRLLKCCWITCSFNSQVLFSEPVFITACEFIEQNAPSLCPAVKMIGYGIFKFCYCFLQNVTFNYHVVFWIGYFSSDTSEIVRVIWIYSYIPRMTLFFPVSLFNGSVTFVYKCKFNMSFVVLCCAQGYFTSIICSGGFYTVRRGGKIQAAMPALSVFSFVIKCPWSWGIFIIKCPSLYTYFDLFNEHVQVKVEHFQWRWALIHSFHGYLVCFDLFGRPFAFTFGCKQMTMPSYEANSIVVALMIKFFLGLVLPSNRIRHSFLFIFDFVLLSPLRNYLPMNFEPKY